MRALLGLAVTTALVVVPPAPSADAAKSKHRSTAKFRPAHGAVIPDARPGWYYYPGYNAIPPEQNRNLDPSNRGSG